MIPIRALRRANETPKIVNKPALLRNFEVPVDCLGGAAVAGIDLLLLAGYVRDNQGDFGKPGRRFVLRQIGV
jgi:hypothetical protein